MLGNIKFIARAERDILFNIRNKFHISAQPCNILYIDILYKVFDWVEVRYQWRALFRVPPPPNPETLK